MLYSISLPILSIAQSSDIMFLNHCTIKSRFICLYTHVDAAMVRWSEYRIGPTPSFFCLLSFLASSSLFRQPRHPCSASARRRHLREPVGDANGKNTLSSPWGTRPNICRPYRTLLTTTDTTNRVAGRSRPPEG